MAPDTVKHISVGIEEFFAEQERRYPNRHKQIHKVCCKQCPSAKGGDPESEDIKATCSKEFIAKEIAFVCAWRPSKLCKGFCDFVGIDQEFLNSIHNGKNVK